MYIVPAEEEIAKLIVSGDSEAICFVNLDTAADQISKNMTPQYAIAETHLTEILDKTEKASQKGFWIFKSWGIKGNFDVNKAVSELPPYIKAFE